MIRKLITVLALGGIAAAAAVGTAGAADWKLNVGTALTVDDPLFQGLLAFEQGVESRTNGGVDVVIFPALSLCEDNECIEQARAGANVAVVIDGGRLGSYVPGIAIVSAPYLAADLAEMKKIVTSSVFGGFNDELREKAGLDILSFNWWQGVRNMYTPDPGREAGGPRRGPLPGSGRAPLDRDHQRDGGGGDPARLDLRLHRDPAGGHRLRRRPDPGRVGHQALRSDQPHGEDRAHQPDDRARHQRRLDRFRCPRSSGGSCVKRP